MTKNLHLYITQEDYQEMAGPDWPLYIDFLQGARGEKLEIQQELEEYIAQHRKQGIKFPIKTATACQSKWTWSTIYLNQLSTASCHRVTPIPFELENFDNFHNIPKKLNDRQLMLEGKWPTGGCEYCQEIENSGGWSDRQHNLDIRGLTPPELEQDPTAISVTPRIVEIFAQNTCNLSCIYCNGNLSSKIQQENIKHGEFNQDHVTIPIITTPTVAAKEYFDRFLSWLEKNIQQLVRLHLLGGETFIQHDLMNSVLDILERNPSPNLEFCIFSNCNVPDKWWDHYINRIHALQIAGNIKVFDLTASIDCWGPEQEYVRSGLNLDKFEKRFAWASQQGDWLRLNANQTVTAMTVKTMPGLIEKLKHYGKNKHIGHYFQFYTGMHMFQHPKIFAWDFWKDDFEKILNAMPTDTAAQREAIPRMQGLQSLLKQSSQNDLDSIKQLHVYLDELDRRRSTNWRSLFSYLDIS
jgi:pyruvate-formate lyase-activating enzyme